MENKKEKEYPDLTGLSINEAYLTGVISGQKKRIEQLEQKQAEFIKLIEGEIAKLRDMPDITICTNESCELRNECFRVRAEPNEYRQPYFMNNPQPANGQCDYFEERDLPKYQKTSI